LRAILPLSAIPWRAQYYQGFSTHRDFCELFCEPFSLHPPTSLDRAAPPKNYKSSISAMQETPFANLDYHKVQLKIFEAEKLGELFCK